MEIKPRYDKDGVTLYCADCLDVMPQMEPESVDAVITDPPYGINGDYASYKDTVSNLSKLVPEFINHSKRIARDVIAVFTGVKNMDLYNGCDWRLAWVVPAGTGVSSWGFTCWTPISVYGKDPFSGNGSRPDVFVDYKPRREGYDHPYEKPLSIMRWILERCTKNNSIILDPFMGSGTTGVAALQLGRRFIGIEIDEKYYQIAEKRIREAQLQIRMPLEFHD